jgi:RNA polymerase sigma-70 factor (ECF subfamily)
METISDAALVAQAQAGCHAALSTLLERYDRSAYAIAFRLMGNHADASDAAQEALLRVFTALQNFQGNSAFSTWLYRIVTNTCLDALRRRGRSRMQSMEEMAVAIEVDALLAHEAQVSAGPAERAEQRELQEVVQREIDRLPPDYKAVIVLRDIRGYTYPEIAEILGTSVGTIKSRLFRARRALRALLVAHAPEVSAEYHAVAS